MIGVTDVLAVYGALLASVGLGWNLYRDLHDRPNVTLNAHIRRLGVGGDGRTFAASPSLPLANVSDALYVCITVVNAGRRPVLITSWGGKWHKPRNEKPTFMIYGRDLPKMLTENQQYQDCSDELVPNIENIKSLSVRDSNGKEWKLSTDSLDSLQEHARTLQAEKAKK
jgi:hypothetical protein